MKQVREIHLRVELEQKSDGMQVKISCLKCGRELRNALCKTDFSVGAEIGFQSTMHRHYIETPLSLHGVPGNRE